MHLVALFRNLWLSRKSSNFYKWKVFGMFNNTGTIDLKFDVTVGLGTCLPGGVDDFLQHRSNFDCLISQFVIYIADGRLTFAGVAWLSCSCSSHPASDDVFSHHGCSALYDVISNDVLFPAKLLLIMLHHVSTRT